MKKIISILTVISLILMGFQMFLVVGENEKEIEISKETREEQRGNILYVGAGQTYNKIQNAIIASKAGDTILVNAGVYYENIIVDKMLSIIGNGTTTTTINGNSINDVVKITADQVNISGFKITDSGRNNIDAGIELINVQNCNITNNYLFRNSIGIYLNASSNNIIIANTIDSFYNNGILISSSSNNSIINNALSSSFGPGIREFGIHLELSSKHNLIKGNYVSSNIDVGIFLDSPPTGIGIVGFNDDNDYYLDINITYNGTAWGYEWPGNGKFDPGILNASLGHYELGDPIIRDDGSKPSEWRSDDIIVTDPLNYPKYGNLSIMQELYPYRTEPDYVPLIDEELPNTFDESLISWADQDGDWGGLSHDVGEDGLGGTADNGEGDGRPTPGEPYVDEDLYINESRKPSNNIIIENKVSNNNYGIYLENASNNILKWNIINNNSIGIYSQCSHNNLFHHNDFINNNNQAYDNGNNLWNTSTHGNHWSGWTTPDNDTNGIVDIPYSITGFTGAKDQYPLVKPFNNYIINLPSTEILMNASFSNSTNKMVYLLIYKTILNAIIKGQLNGSISCTNLELIMINSSNFAGKGFFFANWTATIEGIPYSGAWQGMFYKNTGNDTIFLKGTLYGGLRGITEGYLTESKKGSGIFDVYKSNWTISYLGYEAIYAKLLIDGSITYKNSNILSSKIYILQVSFKGNATGCYNKSLNIVFTHVRINDMTCNYHGSGFSIINYVSIYGSGMGWTYDKTNSKNTVNITGFFTNPILGIVLGKLYDSGQKRTLSLSIIKIDTGLPPRAIISMSLWGPKRVSPGQTINYFLEITNYGSKSVTNANIIMDLPKNVQYISNTGNCSYNALTNEITWLVNITAKNKYLLSAKCKVKWGLSQWTKLVYNGSVMDYQQQKLLAFCSFMSIVITAKDPNLKYGPDGNVTIGQRLNYKIEFENEGDGTAYGVYFTDELSNYLDDSSLQIDQVYSTIDDSIIAPSGRYEPNTRTITWFVGEVGSHKGGYTNISINVRDKLPQDTVILNYATIFFPSVPEVTRTNGIISIIKWNQGPIAKAGDNFVVNTFEELVFDGSGSSDPEMQPLIFKWDFGDGIATAWLANSSTTHTYAQPGNYTVTLSVSDGEFIDSDTYKVWVINEIINSSPDIKDIPTLFVHYYNPSEANEYPGYGYDFSYFIYDPDNNLSELTIRAIAVEQNLMNHIDKDPNNNMRLIFKLPIEIADGRAHPIYLIVSDPFNHEARKLFNITIITNNWPVELVKSIDDQRFDEDSNKANAFKLDYYFNDKDGGTSYEIITLVNSKLNVVIDSDNYIDLSTNEENWYGFEEVIILAKDTQPEQYVYCIFMVYVKPVNDPPVILEIPKLNSTVHEKGVLNLSQYIVDVDHEISDLIIETSDTEHIKINGTILIYKFDTNGEYTIILTISDREYTDSIDLLFNVTDPKVNPDLDSDNDGIPDLEDAFPNDGAASVDSDGDKYPDHWNPGKTETDSTTGLKLDAYPNDPNRYAMENTDNNYQFLYILIIIMIIVVLILASIKLFLSRSKRQREKRPDSDDEILSKMKHEFLEDEPLSGMEYSRNEISDILEKKFKNGQLSEDTYHIIKSEVLFSEEAQSDQMNNSKVEGKE